MNSELKASYDQYMAARQQLLSAMQEYFPTDCLVSWTLVELFEVTARVRGYVVLEDGRPSLVVMQDNFDGEEFLIPLEDNPIKLAE